MSSPTGLANVFISLQPEGDMAFLQQWQREMVGAAQKFPGFHDSQEFNQVPGIQDRWVLVLRFHDPESLSRWLQSDQRRELHEKAAAMAPHQEVIAGVGTEVRPVTMVVATHVRPDQVQAFKEWQQEMSALERTFPGYIDGKLIEPAPGMGDEWSIVVRFDSDENVEGWLRSPQRQAMMSRIDTALHGAPPKKLVADFGGWFNAVSDEGAAPPNWKQALSVLLALYPTVLLMILYLEPLLRVAGMPLGLAVLRDNIISCALLTWLIMPQLTRALSFWLRPRRDQPAWLERAGTVFVLGALLGMLFFFMWLTH